MSIDNKSVIAFLKKGDDMTRQNYVHITDNLTLYTASANQLVCKYVLNSTRQVKKLQNHYNGQKQRGSIRKGRQIKKRSGRGYRVSFVAFTYDDRTAKEKS